MPDSERASSVLAEVGYETRVCETGEEILRLARLLRPPLVVLGVCLPGLSGYECCYQLRAELGRSFPILLVSAVRTEPLDCTVGLLLGADDVLAASTFAPGELLVRVTRFVGLAASGGKVADSDLTDREAEVLALLARGLLQKEMARMLGISPKTVSTHVERIHPRSSARTTGWKPSRGHSGPGSSEATHNPARVIHCPLDDRARWIFVWIACQSPRLRLSSCGRKARTMLMTIDTYRFLAEAAPAGSARPCWLGLDEKHQRGTVRTLTGRHAG